MQIAMFVRCGIFATAIAVLMMGSVVVEAGCLPPDEVSGCEDTACAGDSCATSCGSQMCGGECTGENCATNCIGEDCGTRCSGTDCATNCTGEKCGYDCTGKDCATGCTGELCGRHCSGTDCATNCTGVRCGTRCSGTDCATNCTGKDCGQNCSGENCATNCIGNTCGEKCTGEACATNCLGDGCGNQVGDAIYAYDDDAYIHTEETATRGRKDFNLPCDQYVLDWHCTYQTAETNTKGACLWDEPNTICKPLSTTPPPAAPAMLTLTVPLDINLSELTAEALEDVKSALLATAAAAGGFDPTLVESIVLVQGGVVVGRHRRANTPITVKVVFKDDAVIDLDAATASLNKAITKGAVSVTLAIDGKEITATVIQQASAIAAAQYTPLYIAFNACCRATRLNPELNAKPVLVTGLSKTDCVQACEQDPRCIAYEAMSKKKKGKYINKCEHYMNNTFASIEKVSRASKSCRKNTVCGSKAFAATAPPPSTTAPTPSGTPDPANCTRVNEVGKMYKPMDNDSAFCNCDGCGKGKKKCRTVETSVEACFDRCDATNGCKHINFWAKDGGCHLVGAGATGTPNKKVTGVMAVCP